MLQFEHPTIVILLAILLAFFTALFIYHKDERFKSTSIYTILLLKSLRFISLSIIIILLFQPKWLNEIKQVEKPIIVFLQDVSSSILNYPDSNFYKLNFIENIQQNNKSLSDKFDIYNNWLGGELVVEHKKITSLLD